MNKKQIITILQQAKPDHMEWVKQGYKLLDGQPQSQINKPESNTDCLFGRWYEKEGFKLVNIPELKNIEVLHKEIHTIYTALYYITFDRRKVPRSTIISAGVEVPVEEMEFRSRKLQLLKKKTVTLVRRLDLIEKKVAVITEQDFDSPWLS